MFRKKIVKREQIDYIDSPERLNEMVRVVSSRAWLALYTFFVLIAVALVWAIFGSIPRTVTGKGILIQSGGVIEISANSNGKVKKIYVNAGDDINEKDVIAKIYQPELELQIENLELKLKDLTERVKTVTNFNSSNLELSKSLLVKQEQNLLKILKKNEDRLEFINERIQAQEKLLKEGLITKELVMNTKNQYFEIQEENDKLANSLKEISLKIFETSNGVEIEHKTLQSQILDVTSQIMELKARLILTSIIRSPCRGKIVEVMSNEGELVSIGSAVVSIEPAAVSSNLEAVVYISPTEGKKIQAGMKVRISPSTVRVEEYGYINGEVKQVSLYPSSARGMLKTLGNIELAKSFSDNAPPIAVRVSLKKSPKSFSGYEWTSGKGPKIDIKAGTICKSKITYEKLPPIYLIIPHLE